MTQPGTLARTLGSVRALMTFLLIRQEREILSTKKVSIGDESGGEEGKNNFDAEIPCKDIKSQEVWAGY